MTIQTIKFHKRSTGMTGQVLASPEIEYKLARVEKSYKAFYGVSLGRYKLYNLALDFARQSKTIDGGYIQYSAQAITGIFLDAMHKTLSENLKKKSEGALTIRIGKNTVSNIRDLARQGRGKARKVA